MEGGKLTLKLPPGQTDRPGGRRRQGALGVPQCFSGVNLHPRFLTGGTIGDASNFRLSEIIFGNQVYRNFEHSLETEFDSGERAPRKHDIVCFRVDLLIRRITVVLLVIAALQSGRVIGQELDQDGKAHSWKGSSEQYKVIDFAAAWCRPCWAALPRLQRFADARPSVSVIVVSVDERVEGRDKFVDALGLTVNSAEDGPRGRQPVLSHHERSGLREGSPRKTLMHHRSRPNPQDN